MCSHYYLFKKNEMWFFLNKKFTEDSNFTNTIDKLQVAFEA